MNACMSSKSSIFIINAISLSFESAVITCGATEQVLKCWELEVAEYMHNVSSIHFRYMFAFLIVFRPCLDLGDKPTRQ